METCRHPFSPYPPVMTLTHKLLMAFFAIGIVSFLGTKIPLSTRDALMPAAHVGQAADPQHDTAGSARHPAQPQNASTEPTMAGASSPHQTKSNQRQRANSDRPNSAKDENPADASLVSPVRNSRKFSFPLSHPLEVPKPPASLVWIDGLTAEQDSAIQQLAEEFKQNLQESPEQSSSGDYARAYQDEARINDIRFQARYGDGLWMRHHVASHHLSSGEPQAK
jgi:hypothetical protein